MTTQLQEIVKEFVYIDAPNIRNYFKNSMLKAGDEACGKKKKQQ